METIRENMVGLTSQGAYYNQSHYIEVAQGGVSSRAIHNHTQF